MAKRKGKKTSVLNVIISIAAVLTIAGAAVGLVQHFRGEKEAETRVLKSADFVRCAISTETGEALTDDISGVSTDDFYYIDDNFNVTLDKDATITYSLFYYDEEFNFVDFDEGIEDDFEDSNIDPKNMKSNDIVYVKIMLEPVSDADGVSVSEKAGYVSQAEVTVSTKAVETEE